MTKVHTIKFNNFMSGNYRNDKCQNKKVYGFNLVPTMFIDPTIALIGGVIIGIVVLEKVMEHKGYYETAEALHTCFNIIIPAIAFGFVWHLLKAVSGVFL